MSQMIGVIYTMAYDMGDLELDNSWHVSFAEVYKWIVYFIPTT